VNGFEARGVGWLTEGFAAVLDFDMVCFLVGWSPSFGCHYFEVSGPKKASKNLQF